MMLHAIGALLLAAGALRLNVGMIRRRWNAGQPFIAGGSHDHRGRVLGEIGGAGLVGYLLGRRHSRRREHELELELRRLNRSWDDPIVRGGWDSNLEGDHYGD